MSSITKHTSCHSHFEIKKSATEAQAIISRGEEFLDRAHEVAHQIEAQIRQMLDDPLDTKSTRPQTLS